MKITVIAILSLFLLAGLEPTYAEEAKPLGFTTPVNLSHANSDSDLPGLAVTADGIFSVWTENNAGKSDVFFSKSSDGGNVFSNPIDLSESTASQSVYPQLVESNGHVYVIWQSSLSGTSDILMSRSLDGGATFEKPAVLSDHSKLSAFPQVAVSGNNVYSSWIEKSADNSTNVVFARSEDKGDSFEQPLYVTHATGNSGIPKIFAEPDQVYLVWEDNSGGDYEIYVSKSTDHGASFHTPVNISTNTGQSGTPAVAVSGNNVYAVWMDNTSGNYDIMFTKSTDGADTFSKPVDISKLKGDSGYPQLAVWKGSVYVTWTQTMTGSNYDIFFAKSANNGDAFDKPTNLSNNSGPSGWPKIAADGNVYVSWVDSTPGKFDILITKSTDGGTTFEDPTNLSKTKNESYENEMAALNSTVYMVWQEGQDGNHTIVFSKSAAFVPEFGPFAPVILLLALVSITAASLRSGLRLTIPVRE